MNGTTYYYQVAAINRVDKGALSTTASATTPVVPPAAPTNLTATPASDTQIDLSWQPPTNTGGAEITGYKIQFSSPDASNFRDLRTTSGSTTTYQHTGLTRGTTYYYQVAAINRVDQGAYSSSVSTTTHDVPVAPTNLTATPDGIKINLSWQAPDDDGGTPITGYKIQFSSPDASNFRDLRTTSGSTTTYQHRGLTADTEYHYQVAAINSVDRGAYSSSVSATTHDLPGVPRGLTATPVDDTQINLSWQAPDDDGGTPITGYEISFSTSGGGSFRTDRNTFTYQHMGLEKGDTYHYQIAAINSVGKGAYSNSTSATAGGSGGTDTGSGSEPTAPASFKAIAVSDNQIGLIWEPPPSPDNATISGYKVQFSAGNSFLDLARTDGTTLSYEHTGLAPGDTYHYRVAAISGLGIGTYSNTVSATTYPAIPRSLAARSTSNTRVDLAWQSPPNPGGARILGYQPQVSTDGGNDFTDLQMTDEHTLTYQHRGLSAGTTYHYRIAAINKAGRGAYSNAVSATAGNAVALSVSLEVEDGLRVYPNPASDKVHVTLPSGAYVVRLHTLAGKVVLRAQLQGGGTRTLSLSELQDGVYVLNVHRQDGYSSTHRLIKGDFGK